MSARVVVLVGAHEPGPRRAPDDIVLDLDRMLAALGGTGPHVRHVALRAMRAARDAASRLAEPVTIWLVRVGAAEAEIDRYRARGWTVNTTTEVARATLAAPAPAPAEEESQAVAALVPAQTMTITA